MSASAFTGFQLFDHTPQLFDAMLRDIEHAKKEIYLETYKFGYDSIGKKFRDSLTQKAQQGVRIKILIDSWGTSVSESFFSELIRHGGKVRFFKKIRFFFDFFTKNHRRNHRKLLIIDKQITYIGSANIVGHALNWRELTIKINGQMAKVFKKSFAKSFKIYNKYNFKKFSYRRTVQSGSFEIIQDIPSIYRQQIKKKYERLIATAKKKIIIETPYFLPGYKLRKALADASLRGVDVQVLVPEHSDLKSVDILRSKYLGFYAKNGISIRFYTPHNLHAKCLLIDDEIFSLGSANFDYRSFRYQHEIILTGENKAIVASVKKHIEETQKNCIDFSYNNWLERPLFERMLEQLLVPFRHLF